MDADSASSEIRKRISELAISDLKQFPLWVFTPEEEGIQGQDEECVRPCTDLNILSYSAQLAIVAAEFKAADHTFYLGYCSVTDKDTIDYVQPNIVTPRGQVMFWHGLAKPSSGEIQRYYQKLKKSANEFFPVTYQTMVGPFREGVITGFAYLCQGSLQNQPAWIR